MTSSFGIRILFTVLAASLVLGCAATSKPGDDVAHVNDKTVSPNVETWTSVRLIDLKDQPVVTSGQTTDHKLTYVQIESSQFIKSYVIEDGPQPMLKDVPPFAVSAEEPVSIETHAKDVQQRALYKQYESAWRCRYARDWREIASRDIRVEGPLLFGVPVLQPKSVGWQILIAIDQTSFEAVGLSGVDLSFQGNSPYFTSSIEGRNQKFGLTSKALARNSAFFQSCLDAYAKTVPKRMRDRSLPYVRRLNPLVEKDVSADVDLSATARTNNLSEIEIDGFDAEAFTADEKESFVPKFNIEDIENLIKTASSGTGVGL